VIKKLYKLFEEKYSGALRVLLVLTTLGTLLLAAYMSIDGLIKTRAIADKEDQVTAVAFSVVEDLLFQEQIETLEEKEVKEEKKEEERVPEKIKAIHASMAKHFKDETANKEQFEEFLKPITLQGILELMKDGMWMIGNNSAGWQVDIPEDNEWNCAEGQTKPALTQTFAQDGIPTSITTGDLWVDTNDSDKLYRAESAGADQITWGGWVALPLSAQIGDQYSQLIDHMVSFWKSAEKGTDTNSSKFNMTVDFNGRLGQVIAPNDLLLCSFHDSLDELDEINAKKQDEALEKQLEGMDQIGMVGEGLGVLFKFFAMFAAVVIALMLYRIQQTIRRND